MSPERVSQIQEHSEVLFRPEQSRIAEEYRKRLLLAQHAARQTNNAAAMIPTEAACYAEEVKSLALARARSITDAYNAYGMQAGAEAERSWMEYYQIVTAVRRSVFSSEVEMRAVRLNLPLSPQLGSAVASFERRCSSVIAEALSLLAQQRVAMESSGTKVLAPTHVLDTCIFNWMADDRLEVSDLPPGARFAITHIQLDEMNRTADSKRRVRLYIAQTALHCQLIPTETFCFGLSRWTLARLGTAALYTKLINELGKLNGNKANNAHDALIAEVAIVNGYTLVTADRDLASVTGANGGKVLLFTSPRAASSRKD